MTVELSIAKFGKQMQTSDLQSLYIVSLPAGVGSGANACCADLFGNFSKVSTLLNFLYDLTAALTFENFSMA